VRTRNHPPARYSTLRKALWDGTHIFSSVNGKSILLILGFYGASDVIKTLANVRLQEMPYGNADFKPHYQNRWYLHLLICQCLDISLYIKLTCHMFVCLCITCGLCICYLSSQPGQLTSLVSSRPSITPASAVTASAGGQTDTSCKHLWLISVVYTTALIYLIALVMKLNMISVPTVATVQPNVCAWT
jgi:hypothetical protein